MSLVQMLTILGSLGIVGATVTYLLNSLREHLQNRKERVGLARLLYHEMEANNIALSNQICQLSDKRLGEILGSGKDFLHLTTDSWEDARVRVARLFRREEFRVICDYYRSLRALKDYIQEHQLQSDKTDLDEVLEGTKDTRSQARTSINKYQAALPTLNRYKVLDRAAETP